MRVITGMAKGRKLSTLPGNSIRPTTDFVKQAIFNGIQFDIEGRYCLDLFAGSGQLGIEALSRGAAYVDFVDSDRAAARIVLKNLEHCGLQTKARVHVREATAFLSGAKTSYDLIFLDPPYNSQLASTALKEIIRIDILRIGGIIMCESAVGAPIALPPPYTIQSHHVYGRKAVTLYTRFEDGLS